MDNDHRMIPTAESIETIADKYLKEYVDDPRNELLTTHHERLRGAIHGALMEFYELKFPGCRACADTGHHLARAEIAREIEKDLRHRAGVLYSSNQDNEARYLRDEIATPITARVTTEIQLAEKFNRQFHQCTLTGLAP